MMTTRSAAVAIGVGEVAPRHQRDAERGKESRRQPTGSARADRRRRSRGPAFYRELKAVAERAGVTPRHVAAEGDAFDARTAVILAAPRGRNANLFRRPAVRITGTFTRATLGFEAGARGPERQQRPHQHAGSGQQQERSARAALTANARPRSCAGHAESRLVLLLAGAGMLVRTLLALRAARPGFETQRVLAVNVPVFVQPDAGTDSRFLPRGAAEVTAVPGVERVASAQRAVA